MNTDNKIYIGLSANQIEKRHTVHKTKIKSKPEDPKSKK